MNQKNREPGWYWVKRLWDKQSEFEIAWFVEGEGWLLTGCETWFYEDECELEIDERRIVREEPSK